MQLRESIIRVVLAMMCATSLLSVGPVHAQKSQDTLRFGLGGALDVIDPYYTGDREVTMVVGEMVFDTLIYRDPLTFEHKPLLATAWRWLNDKTLELDLREDVTWQDGKPFTADDVTYTFGYITNPANKIWRPQWTSWIERVEAASSHKVRLHLKAPFGPALEYLAQVLPILPKDFYGPGGTAGGNGRLVGTGPYRITSFQPGKGVSLEKNANYFKGGPKGTPSIGRAVFRHIPDQATQVAELVSGGIDWIWRVPSDQVSRLSSVPRVAVASGGTMRIFWVGFDAKKGPFQNLRVRRAVAHALDRQTMAKELMGASTELLDVPCYPTQFGCIGGSDVPKYGYDRAEGQVPARRGRPAERVRDDHGDLRAGAEPHLGGGYPGVSACRRHQGRDQRHLDQGLFRGRSGRQGAAQAGVLRSIQHQRRRHPTARMVRAAAASTLSAMPQLGQWLKEAGSTGDLAKRKALYQQSARRIVDQSYWVPLFIQSVNYAFAKDLDFRSWPDENPRFYLTKWK